MVGVFLFSVRVTQKTDGQRGRTLALLGLMTLVTLAATIGGLAEVDIGLTSIETRTENIVDSLQTVREEKRAIFVCFFVFARGSTQQARNDDKCGAKRATGSLQPSIPTLSIHLPRFPPDGALMREGLPSNA